MDYKLDPSPRIDPTSRQSDWAVVRLDRQVTNHHIPKINPNKVRDDESIHIIGYPVGLPLKYAGNAKVRNDSNDAFFIGNTDSLGGNSGSPIFNSNTHEIEGILVRGAPDFEKTENQCAISMVCPVIDAITSCQGEACTRTKEFNQHIPNSE